MINVAVDGVSVNTACRQRQVGYRFDHEKGKAMNSKRKPKPKPADGGY